MNFDHVHLFAHDPHAMAEWFEEMLQGQIFGGIASAERPRIDVKIGGLVVFISPRSDQQGTSTANGIIEHLAFSVPDVDKVISELKAKGAVVTLDPSETRPGLINAFIRGPEGLKIELLHRRPVP